MENKVLLEGTKDEGTLDEYVSVIVYNIMRHATIPVKTRVSKPNGTHKDIQVAAIVQPALEHVLRVLMSGEEVTDAKMKWVEPKKLVIL